MSYSWYKIDNLISDLENQQSTGIANTKKLTETLNNLLSIIKRLKYEKNNIDPRNCAECSSRQHVSGLRRLFSSKQLDQQSELEKFSSDLKIMKAAKNEAEKLLEDTKSELKRALKENENITKQFEAQKEANVELLHSFGCSKIDNQELETFRKNVDKMKAKNEDLTKTIEQLEKEKEQSFEKLNEEEKKNNIILAEISELKNKLMTFDNENKRVIDELQIENEKLKASLMIKNTEISILKEKEGTRQNTTIKQRVEIDNPAIEQLQSNLKEVNQEREIYNDKIKSLEIELNRLEDKCIEFQTENEMLSRTKQLYQKQIDELKREKTNVDKESALKLKLQETEIGQIHKEKKKLIADLLDIQQQIEEVKTCNGVVKSELELSKRENEKLLQQIEKLTQKPRRKIELNVFSSMKQGLTDIAMHDLSGKLKQTLDKEDIDVILRPTATATNVKGPSVVFCISISRLGSDVQEALKGISVSSDVAIIIFHHKEAHALPSQSSEKILTGSDYKQLGSIIDMAVLSSKGVYSCDMNNVGFTKLVAFLKRFLA